MAPESQQLNERERAAEGAVLRLQEEIRSGRFVAGDRLPPERELSQRLGVSRPTVREAIQSLATLNIVEVRHGSGTYVASLNLLELLEPLEFALEVSTATVDELFELRLAIEPLAASLAAERATQRQREKILQLAKASARRGVSRRSLVNVDIELHTLVVDAAGNAVLSAIYRTLTPLTRASREITSRIPGATRRAAADHRRIADAIADGEPAAASNAMRDHLLGIRKASPSA